MSSPLFITGIGTGVGKTVVSAIVTQALRADYWKPVQAGFEDGTDALTVRDLIDDSLTVHQEVYKLALPASPHIAAEQEHIKLKVNEIVDSFHSLKSNNRLIIEGAGGLLVPLNEKETIADLIKGLKAKVIIVSRNYLGSINHSLLTASYCRAHNIDVAGWIFNDHFMNYEEDIVTMSGIPSLGSVQAGKIDRQFVHAQAQTFQTSLSKI